MSLHWISLNNRLQQGILLINNLHPVKFELLLTHISESKSEDFFSDSELKKLEETLKLNANQLQLLLQSISYIFKQSMKVILKPTDLQKQLVESLSFDQEKGEIFVKEWSKTTKNDLGEFENRDKLENISWELNLQIGSDLGTKQALPSARIQLDLAKVNNENTKEKLTMELSEDDLLQLYNNLEAIQLKLDNLLKK